MTQKLSPGTALMLTVPPLLWAGNAVVGRLISDLVPPITLNFLRWSIAFLILLPMAGHLLKPQSALWPHWRRFALLSLLGVGCYNALQYLALQTSTPLNVTLVAASTPVFMLAIGALFFKTPVRRAQWLGAALSIAGVLMVLSRGDWQQLLQVSFVVGDIYILLATACWAIYSWLLTQRNEPDEIRNHWAAFLMAQVVFGLGWAGLFSGAGARRFSLQMLGLGRANSRASGGWFFCQPHAAVCRHHVECFLRRVATVLSRCGFWPHCEWHLGIV
jgi:drug/metabolite transporter (DMT)-like permease